MRRKGGAKGYSSRLMLSSLGVEKRVTHLLFTYQLFHLMQNSTDIRTKFDDAASDIQSKTPDAIDCSKGVARAISSFIVPSLSWQDIPYFKCITKMPIVLKGVQRIEDVLKAGCRPLHPRGPPTPHSP